MPPTIVTGGGGGGGHTKFTLNYPVIFFSRGLKYEFEIAVVNEPSVLEPLEVYCIKCQLSNRLVRETIEYNYRY